MRHTVGRVCEGFPEKIKFRVKTCPNVGSTPGLSMNAKGENLFSFPFFPIFPGVSTANVASVPTLNEEMRTWLLPV